MHDVQKKLFEALRLLQKHGWRVVGDTGSHFKAIPPDPTKPMVYMAGSPSDRRAWMNIRSQLRRSGAWFIK